MGPIISVIVPAYNVAPWIARCLDSILVQTHINLEIIVVNDGSTDATGTIIDSYAAKDSRVRAIHKENGGVTSARLRGVEEATGEWIGFVDGDDEIEPDMYERLLGNALKYNADVSHCGYQMVFPGGRVNYFHNLGCIKEQDTITAICDLLEGTLVEPGLWNKLYRNHLFSDLASRMDLSIRINEDLLMNYFLFSGAKRSVFEDWCPYHYIVRSTSASRSKLNDHKIYDPIRVKEIILANASDVLKPAAQKALVNTCVYSYCSLVMEKEQDVHSPKEYLRNKLKEHYDWCSHLPKRTKLLADMIVKNPGLFALIYPIYVRFFQKSLYN